jgi:hypothetical protein
MSGPGSGACALDAAVLLTKAKRLAATARDAATRAKRAVLPTIGVRRLIAEPPISRGSPRGSSPSHL